MRAPSLLGTETVTAVLCLFFWAEECVRALLSELACGLDASPPRAVTAPPSSPAQV